MHTGRPASTLLPLFGALLGGLIAVIGLSPVQPAAATVAAGDFVKQYVVAASYDGEPETLSRIAERLLGSPDAAAEIFALNVGRRQADGDALVDPATIRAGWILVLPWDAVGPGVVRAEMPQVVAPPSSSSHPPPVASSTTAPPTALPTATSSPTPPPVAADRCVAVVANSRTDSQWALDLFAPGRSWERTRGDGQTVAIIDSGVDGTQPQLAGRLVNGADIVAGNVRGNVDCLGSGTAVAGVIAAQVGKDGRFTGIAPEVTILPVRVSITEPHPRPEDVAVGIEVAVSAGATVLTVDATADLGHRRVAEAIATALANDVVVVCAATAGLADGTVTPTTPTAATGDPSGALRVGGVGKNGELAGAYLPGAIDVVAPGINVVSLGINGSGPLSGDGTHLAMGFVAAEAALIRAAHPRMNAAQVIQRIKTTADPLGKTAPDQKYGWGMINPNAAVELAADSDAQTGSEPASGSGLFKILLLVALAILGVVAVLFVRTRGNPLARLTGRK